jgi:molybdopterin molybdotransferase
MRQIGMIEPSEAMAVVMAHGITLASEEVGLEHASGRALSRALVARMGFPLFDKAAVDGIGISAADDSSGFHEIGTVTAGEAPSIHVGKGECIKIMTGAPVPAGIERVIRFEYTEHDGRNYRIVKTEKSTNIAYKDEDIRAGDPLLGIRRLLPQDIGILAGQGYGMVPVIRRPRLSILVTGNELYEPGVPLPPGGIYDSNSYQLAAMAVIAGAEVMPTVRVPDTMEATVSTIRSALDRSDLIVLSGGVSMGELDYVPEALKAAGVGILFHGVAMKPGKPTLFGIHGSKMVFGLPGNPVSTFVQFELFIAPLLYRMQGLSYTPKEAMLPLAETFVRKNADRHEYLPARVVDGAVRLVGYMGSGHLTALADADALVLIPRGTNTMEAGERVNARFIR